MTTSNVADALRKALMDWEEVTENACQDWPEAYAVIDAARDFLAASVASPAAPASPSVAQAEPSEDTERLDWLLKHISVSFGMKWHRTAIDSARASAGEAQATLPSTPKAEGEGKQS